LNLQSREVRETIFSRDIKRTQIGANLAVPLSSSIHSPSSTKTILGTSRSQPLGHPHPQSTDDNVDSCIIAFDCKDGSFANNSTGALFTFFGLLNMPKLASLPTRMASPTPTSLVDMDGDLVFAQHSPGWQTRSRVRLAFCVIVVTDH